MDLSSRTLEGRFVCLEAFAPDLKEEVRAAIDCDAEAWAIIPINPMGAHFDAYWVDACGARLDQRIVYAIRRRTNDQVVGTSSFYTTLADQDGIEIGTTFLRPEVRAGVTNPEAKLLMLEHAFASGAVRVQFKVDTRNERSQRAVAKLGAVHEGVLRKDRLTWTGYVRDTVYFSILSHEWPEVKAKLMERVAAAAL